MFFIKVFMFIFISNFKLKSVSAPRSVKFTSCISKLNFFNFQVTLTKQLNILKLFERSEFFAEIKINI